MNSVKSLIFIDKNHLHQNTIIPKNVLINLNLLYLLLPGPHTKLDFTCRILSQAPSSYHNPATTLVPHKYIPTERAICHKISNTIYDIHTELATSHDRTYLPTTSTSQCVPRYSALHKRNSRTKNITSRICVLVLGYATHNVENESSE